jgi:hypothetical protein
MEAQSAEFVVSSRCECQATLAAELTRDGFVVHGSAYLLRKREKAPAHSIHPENEVFDIGWLCPFCGRNVLRTFSKASLRKVAPKPAA